ncbi:MAG: PIG-L deacetylase family protein, partial [Limisphaerales bacterium]
MNPYLDFVSSLSTPILAAKRLPLGNIPACPKPEIAPNAPKALFFAPHPDDETIQGGLMLRLLREAKWNAINVAVTQGSKKERQAGRYEELKDACNYLGFGLLQTAPNGLEKVTPKTRESDQALWSQMVKVIAEILSKNQPKVIFFPHDQDWNGTHIGVHHLIMDALRS